MTVIGREHLCNTEANSTSLALYQPRNMALHARLDDLVCETCSELTISFSVLCINCLLYLMHYAGVPNSTSPKLTTKFIFNLFQLHCTYKGSPHERIPRSIDLPRIFVVMLLLFLTSLLPLLAFLE